MDNGKNSAIRLKEEEWSDRLLGSNFQLVLQKDGGKTTGQHFISLADMSIEKVFLVDYEEDFVCAIVCRNQLFNLWKSVRSFLLLLYRVWWERHAMWYQSIEIEIEMHTHTNISILISIWDSRKRNNNQTIREKKKLHDRFFDLQWQRNGQSEKRANEMKCHFLF